MTLQIEPQDTDEVAVKKFLSLWELIFEAEVLDFNVWTDLLYSRVELKRRGFIISITQAPLVMHKDEVAKAKP